jgi:proline iminopeptidase
MHALALVLFFATRLFTAPDGIEVHYSTIGHGRPVVILAGGPGMAAGYMQPVGEEVSRDAQAVLLEQRGTGRSTVSTYDANTISIAKNVEDIETLRKELHAEKLTLLGHSWGGMLAQAYAAAHPDRVGRLILVDPGGPTLAFAEPFGKALESRYTTEEVDAIDFAMKKKDRVGALRAKTPAYFAKRERAREFAASIDERSYEPRVNRLLFAEMSKGYDLRDGLRSVHAPVFIIQGRQDPLQASADVKAALPQAQVLWIDDAGHFPWIEHPREFRRALDAAMR